MSNEWLYQIRIKVSEKLSKLLREGKMEKVSKQIYDIASKHGTSPVCTYDAFVEYCQEAEKEGVEKYSLYLWTKQTIENPEKKHKHEKSFAFYKNQHQVYEKSLAISLFDDLKPLLENKLIEDLKLIDSNPKNNPQPPKNLR
tara:strand:- start:339 stop:764 length:426 start_codon:yes stop_codon:yes gene_type:complete